MGFSPNLAFLTLWLNSSLTRFYFRVKKRKASPNNFLFLALNLLLLWGENCCFFMGL
jgi:hypothetical protein